MHIKKLHLKNYQSHKDTVIDFSTGLNCIVGSTNSGKSSIIRALKFILCGEPWHKSFVNRDATYAEIAIELSDGTTIIRRKGDDKNEYVVNGTLYQNFGVAVPADVQRVLGLNPVEIDGEMMNLNFADQLDSLFLVDESDTKKAIILNKLSGLDSIDDVLHDLSDDKREETHSSKIYAKEIESLEERMKSFTNIDSKKNTVFALELQIDQYQKREVRLQDHTAVKLQIDKWKEQKMEIKRLEANIAKIDQFGIDDVLKRIGETETKRNELYLIKEESHKIEEYEKRIEEASVEMMELMEAINVKKTIEFLDTTYATIDELNKAAVDVAKVEAEVRALRGMDNTMKELDTKIINVTQEYRDLLKGLKTCPICGTDITDKEVDKCLQGI